MTTHRGAYLHALGVIPEAGLTQRSSYLWTLPMFHCNGWAYTWAVTAMGAKHVCLPKVEAKPIWRALTQEGVSHLCAAPTVLTTIVGADEAESLDDPVEVFVGGAPPAPALLEKAAEAEPPRHPPVRADRDLRADRGVRVEPRLGRPPRRRAGQAPRAPGRRHDRLRADARRRRGHGGCKADGEALGEVCMRGDNVMTGYYRDEEATEEAFKGGWFHSGDIGVVHPDGYVELRDRLKDVIISGGENIATIEVEQALAAHPSVSEVAVVAAPHERWGEVPVAFVTGDDPDPEELVGLRPRPPRPLQGAEADRGGRRAAQDGHRQDPEVQAQGRPERRVLDLGDEQRD